MHINALTTSMFRARVRQAILLGGALGLLGLGGCGWTPRDEFYASRAVAFIAAPGSGARYVSLEDSNAAVVARAHVESDAR